MKKFPTYKKKIVNELKNNLKNKIERVYIIGSFVNEDWNPQFSDIDLLCVDNSFVFYPNLINKRNIRYCLLNLNYKFDILTFTWDQFNLRFKNNEKFKGEIEGALLIC